MLLEPFVDKWRLRERQSIRYCCQASNKGRTKSAHASDRLTVHEGAAKGRHPHNLSKLNICSTELKSQKGTHFIARCYILQKLCLLIMLSEPHRSKWQHTFLHSRTNLGSASMREYTRLMNKNVKVDETCESSQFMKPKSPK